MESKKSIVGDFTLFANILKNSGYRSISYGAAEIIDNAIDANARDVLIIFESHGSKIKNIGYIDNGFGMDLDVLWNSVTVGGRSEFNVNNLTGKRGKYGFGLPGASAAYSDLTEVYSWTKNNPGIVYKVILDINKLNEGISRPEISELPEPYRSFHLKNAEVQCKGTNVLGGVDFATSGTLVLWKGCKRVKPVSTKIIVNNYIRKDVGRMFRHFITSDKFSRERWNKCNIVTLYNIEDSNSLVAEKIKPNDPLYIMEDHLLSAQGVNFELKDNLSNKEFELNHSIVYARFSLVSSDVFKQFKGKKDSRLKKNVGISIVREGREIDLSHFAYFDHMEPRHRWWGVEIFFEKNADSYFGVPANKQYTESLKEVKEQDDLEDAYYPEGSDLHEWPIWLTLERKFGIISTLNDFLKKIRSSGKTESDPGGNELQGELPGGDLTPEGTGIDAEPTTSGTIEEKHSQEAIKNAKKELLNLGISEPTEYQIDRFIKNNVVLSYRSLGEQAGFISVSITFGVCHLIINEDSLFYRYVLSELKDTGNEALDNAFRAIELMLLGYARCMDLNRNYETHKEFPRVLKKWTHKVEEILDLYFDDE